ncbi:PrsW family intramembrane metalloprotease [Leptospira langatensis]|uniref:PrsW family intramembrane metalloprotease n=1 Tax=Leptospira langatensis TaxID=2484983 RepID=A0A5F1ZWA1_9LEPT|nr:PrsW family glutamic-type intramembrane protease [Leptospira langatensis]TGJ98218.1 PrsW family intramembrane metalloprotease [Leptospira langatensis]TGL43132.1 PrsW family intramembrane metalloprotease [Leptospira langatensis]
MNIGLLAVLSILPWAFYLVYTHPKTNQTRLFTAIVFSLVLGWISTELVLKLSAFLWPETSISAKVSKSILSQTVFLAFIKAGMMEELCKSMLILILALLISFDRHTMTFLPETFIIGGFVGLGFAGIENYQYIMSANEQDRVPTFIVRTLKSSNAHLLVNLCFALFLIKSNYKPYGEKVLYILKGFLLAVAQHGLFDFFVFPSGRFGVWIAMALFVGIWVWIVKDRRKYILEVAKTSYTKEEILKPSLSETIR